MGNYALEGCQNGTIAALMGWDKQVIIDRPDILSFLHKKRCQRKLKLRKAQSETAFKSKNSAMQIFLGKNDLEQSDKQDHNVSGEISVHIHSH